MSKILLIEDEIVLGETLVEIFEMFDHEVTWVKMVQDVQEVLPQLERFDLICSDFHLPDGTLKDICELKGNKHFDEIPLLVLSATASEDDRRFIELHSSASMFKPFLVNDLMDKVNALIK